MAFRKDNKIKSNFSKISIGLASPEEILENSSGEVLKPETINYRTYKPERDGLFCERIFGPIKDYECHCGKYKRIRYKGIVCDRCGVEVTEKKVRRERMGHIQLVVPVAHIWYFRSLPNKIGYLLGLPTKKLDSIIYYERYVVIQAGVMAGEIAEYDLLSEEEYLDLMEKLPKDNQFLEDSDPNKFIARMGAEAIYDLLARLDLDALSYELRHRAGNDASQQRKNEALKRLQVVESFRASRGRNKPEWMIMKRMDFLNRNRNNPIHSHWRILHRILSKKIQCVPKYFSFWCISFHPQPPPLPDSGMLYKPYSPVHTPEAAHCNKLILPPLLYSV